MDRGKRFYTFHRGSTHQTDEAPKTKQIEFQSADAKEGLALADFGLAVQIGKPISCLVVGTSSHEPCMNQGMSEGRTQLFSILVEESRKPKECEKGL